MATMQALIKRHPVLSFYVLTFTISWGSFLAAVGLGPGSFGATPEQLQAMVPLLVPAMLLGPGLVSILLTGLVDGRAGLRAFRARLLKWRVGARWYAVALLTAPLVFTAVYLPLSLVSPAFLPRLVTARDKPAVLLMGLALGLGAGIFEELGWTGFAVPGLRKRHGVLATGLVVGILWGAWHVPLFVWLSGDATGALSLPHFLPAVLFCLGVLPVFRVLMVWVYDRTGSLPVAMLMHGSLTGGVSLTFIPLALSGVPLVTWYLVLVAALWGVVAAVAVADGGQRARPPLQRQQVDGQRAPS